MVKQLFVCDLFTVSHGAEMFNLDAVLAPDVFIDKGLVLNH